VNAPPEKVWEVITDVNHYHEFMPKMVKSQAVGLDRLKIIQQRRPTSAAAVEAILGPTPPNPALLRVPGQKYVSYFYGHLKVPFPLADRWYIVKVVWDETQAAQHIFTCSWYFMIGNLREYSGEWKVKPFGDNQTHLTYRVVTDPGGFVPKFIVKDFTTKILPKVIAGVRKRVAYR
jgi:ribosome-associated toxin RatA of RatAB toxin-antitoxin module